MPKFQFLLLDAGVIIGAHELGVWQELVQKCGIAITRTVKDQETYYWSDEQGVGHEIDLDQDVEGGRIKCVDVPLSQVKDFASQFDPSYLDRLDPGEADSLTFLVSSDDEWLVASSDSGVFKILSRLRLGERGRSLEEILQQIGLGREVDWKYCKAFRELYTLQGGQDSITGIGLKNTSS